MLIVPVKGDKIKISGWADEQIVTSYTALKKGGAVYVKQPLDPAAPYVALSAIQAINNVIVTQKPNGLLMPKGLITRKLNLPQIGDSIEVHVNTDPQGVVENAFYDVTDLRLTNKPARPVEIVCDKSKFSLADIVSIKRKLGFEKFNVKDFRAFYLDYLPIGSKA